MELVQIMRVFRRRWWVALLPPLVAAVIVLPDLLRDGPAGSGGFTTVVRYTAAQQIEAIPGRDGDFQDVWLASELTVNAFTDWVRSGGFREEIALLTRANGAEINPAALAIAADNARSIGQIYISWPDADELALIVQAAVEVLQTRNQAYFPQLGSAPALVTLLEQPSIAPAPPPLADRFAPLVRLGIALLAGIALAFFTDYLDPRLHTREELEALGVRVLASIPRR